MEGLLRFFYQFYTGLAKAISRIAQILVVFERHYLTNTPHKSLELLVFSTLAESLNGFGNKLEGLSSAILDEIEK